MLTNYRWYRAARWAILSAVGSVSLIFVSIAFYEVWGTASRDDRFSILGNVLGGMVGVFGAALAVYLTLWTQRKDESQKASAAVYREVMELTRFVIRNLRLCRVLYDGSLSIAGDALPSAMAIPEPVIYPAVADRIGRLGASQQLVRFYIELSEARLLVEYIFAMYDWLHEGRAMAFGQGMGNEKFELLGEVYVRICRRAEAIIGSADIDSASEPSLRASLSTEIKHALAQARATFPNLDDLAVSDE